LTGIQQPDMSLVDGSLVRFEGSVVAAGMIGLPKLLQSALRAAMPACDKCLFESLLHIKNEFLFA
jgi:hypothetical protein